MIKILGLTILLLSGCAVAEEKQKSVYWNYSFEPVYPDDYQAQDLKDNIQKDFKHWHEFKTYQAMEVEGNNWALYSVHIPTKQLNMEFRKYARANRDKVRQSKGIEYQGRWSALAFQDEKGAIYGKESHKKFINTFHKGQDYYGCIQSSPLFSVPLFNEKTAVVLITGDGIGPGDPAIPDYINMQVYAADTGQELINEWLMIMNYKANSYAVGHDTGSESKGYIEGVNYMSGVAPLPISGQEIPSIPDDGFGRKLYAKLFTGDYNNDGRLEFLFWKRQYKSTKTPEPIGFTFEKEFFKYYVENSNSNGFDEVKITNEEGVRIIEKNLLSWTDGYPNNNNLCEGHEKKYKMMNGVIDKSIAIQ